MWWPRVSGDTSNAPLGGAGCAVESGGRNSRLVAVWFEFVAVSLRRGSVLTSLETSAPAVNREGEGPGFVGFRRRGLYYPERSVNKLLCSRQEKLYHMKCRIMFFMIL